VSVLGSTPQNLPLFENASQDIKDKVTLFRGISDFEELEDIIASGAKSIAIIGGGFLGSELACSIARRCEYWCMFHSSF
jgi:programmed cell death 8 (apoptosis-inducing factor)